MLFSNVSGLSVGAKRSATFPSLSIRNLAIVKKKIRLPDPFQKLFYLALKWMVVPVNNVVYYSI